MNDFLVFITAATFKFHLAFITLYEQKMTSAVHTIHMCICWLAALRAPGYNIVGDPLSQPFIKYKIFMPFGPEYQLELGQSQKWVRNSQLSYQLLPFIPFVGTPLAGAVTHTNKGVKYNCYNLSTPINSFKTMFSFPLSSGEGEIILIIKKSLS